MYLAEHFTVEELSKVFSYDKDTGIISWAIKRKKKVGTRCGSMTRNGYRRVSLYGISMAEHRVAWALHYGEWPQGQIDHINRNRTDNRINNLRLATQAENCTNRLSKNRHGLSGVALLPHGRWQAQTQINGVPKYLGTFDTKELAHQAYVDYVSRTRADYLPKEST
jgi:hypothetical protein